MPTFKQARYALLTYLREHGWTVSDALKVPHATSPDGRYRLWFKPQAVYYTNAQEVGPGRSGHTFGNARSLWVDIRETSPAHVVDLLSR